MHRTQAIALALALWPAFAEADSKLQFAGESQGISFHLQIGNQCQDGSKVTIQLKSSLDHAAIVSFRLNDSDWRKSFTHLVGPDGKETSVSFSPGEGLVCHPYIDQVYLEGQQETVTQSAEADTASP